MANIFAILTAIVLAVATFIAFQNKGRPEEEGRGYAGWIFKRENMEKALERKQVHLADRRDDLADTESELVDYNGKNEILDTQVTAQKEKNADLAAKVEAKEAEAQAKAAEVASKKESIEEFGDVDQVLAQLTQLQRDLAQIELDIAQREAQEADLEAQRAGVDRSLADVRKRINWRVSGSSNPELRTSVRSVYATLGFVTMTGGDNLGIVKNSTLEVVRDGEVVGKLLVTTVESHSAAADIIPGSVVQGDSVRVGDRVRAPQVASPEPTPGPAAAPVAPAANPEPAEPAPAPAGDPEPEPAPSTEPFGG
ncbi:MAG: hypothetical protein VCA38_12965 [Roseibacillus sp.]